MEMCCAAAITAAAAAPIESVAVHLMFLCVCVKLSSKASVFGIFIMVIAVIRMIVFAYLLRSMVRRNTMLPLGVLSSAMYRLTQMSKIQYFIRCMRYTLCILCANARGTVTMQSKAIYLFTSKYPYGS